MYKNVVNDTVNSNRLTCVLWKNMIHMTSLPQRSVDHDW